MASRALIALLIGICIVGSTAHATPATPFTGPWDTITFQMNSWGKPVVSWIVTADGSGSWSESKDGASFTEYSVVVHELAADKAHYEALVTILKRLPIPAPVADDCHDFMTDAPYGNIRLTRGATTVELSYNAGCMDAPYRDYLEVLKAADATVAMWGKPGKVLRTENRGGAQQ